MGLFRRRGTDPEAGRRVCGELDEIIRAVEPEIRPDVSTADLDALVAKLTAQRGLKFLFKENPRNAYPAHITASVNEQVVNALPSERRLREGDLLSLQFGVERDGTFACQAWTFPVGRITDANDHLCRAGLAALSAAISRVAAGQRVWAVTCAIHETLERHGFTPGRDFMGHAVGRNFHEDPGIPCFKSPHGKGDKSKFVAGQLLSVHVFAHEGSPRTQIARDGWSVVSVDGTKSVHFSAMVAVEDDGCEVLTRRLLGAERPLT